MADSCWGHGLPNQMSNVADIATAKWQISRPFWRTTFIHKPFFHWQYLTVNTRAISCDTEVNRMQWVQVFYNILRNISLKITFIRLDVAQKSARRVGVKKGALTLSSNSVSQSLRPVSLRRPRPSSKSLASRRIRLPSFRSFIVVSFLFFVLHFFLRSQSPSRRPSLHNQVQRR